MQLYFAYGSNLCSAQMTGRCPNHRFHCPASLAEHRFLIGRRGYATIAPAAGEFVCGVIYELTAGDEARLDRCEGVASGSYEKQYHSLQGLEGEIEEVLVYVDLRLQPGIPGADYMEKILTGAADFELPLPYQAFLRSFAPNE